MKETLTRLGVPVVCTGLGVALVVAVWQAPSRSATLVEVLHILASWPVVVGILTLSVGGSFRRELRDVFSRIDSIRAGGLQIDLGQAQPRPSRGDLGQEDKTGIRLTKEQVNVLRSKMDELFRQVKLKEDEKQVALKLVTQQQTEIEFWKFEFLSVFLVPMTQNVLRWFAALQGHQVTRALYDQFWRRLVQDSSQRDTMLSVLLSYGLLVQEGEKLRVSDTGLQFLAHMAWKTGQGRA